MKMKEVHELTGPELHKKLEDARRELLHLRIQGRIGQLENTARIPLVRRDIARLCTEQRQRLATPKQETKTP